MPRDGTVVLDQGGVLCLDLSSTIGWCYAAPGVMIPKTGFFRLPVLGGEGARYAAFDEKLADIVECWEPRQMLLEAPIPLPAMNNFRAAAQQFGLRALVYAEGHRSSCTISEIDVLSARREVMGSGSMSSDVAKKLVVRFCHEKGIKVANHHAGDAAILWLWHRGRLAVAKVGLRHALVLA